MVNQKNMRESDQPASLKKMTTLAYDDLAKLIKSQRSSDFKVENLEVGAGAGRGSGKLRPKP